MNDEMENVVSSEIKEVKQTYCAYKFDSYRNNVQKVEQLIKHWSGHKKTTNNSLKLKK